MAEKDSPNGSGDGNTETKPPEGTTTPGPEGATTPTETTVKLVPESQVMSLKAKHKKELEGLKKSYDELHESHLTLGSEKTSLEEKANRVPELETSLAESQGQLYVSEVARTTLETSGLGQRRTFLAQSYGIAPESLAEKGTTELDALEEALKLVAKPREARFAITGGGGGTAPETPMERAARIIAEAEKKGQAGGSFNKPPE